MQRLTAKPNVADTATLATPELDATPANQQAPGSLARVISSVGKKRRSANARTRTSVKGSA